MGKFGGTKRNIVEMLSQNEMTLSELAQKLDLAPSTVKQHLDDLQATGAISLVDNPHIKKWKYYRINPESEMYAKVVAKKGASMKTNTKYLYGGLAVLVLVALGILFLNSHVSTPLPPGSYVVQLTDPPVVPTGTQALVVSYSSVALHESGNGNTTGWVNTDANGTVNLMNLTNVTQTIAVFKANANASFDMVRLSISNAYIRIDNNTYNVTVPSSQVTAKVNATSGTNQTGGVLVDMNPVVVQIYTSANQSVFVMVPSVRAVVIGKSFVTIGAGRVGFRGAIPPSIVRKLNVNKTITATNAAASVSGNTTNISLTVRNNGNSTVVLKSLMLYGYMLVLPGERIYAANDARIVNTGALPLITVNISAHQTSNSGVQSNATVMPIGVIGKGGLGTGESSYVDSRGMGHMYALNGAVTGGFGVSGSVEKDIRDSVVGSGAVGIGAATPSTAGVSVNESTLVSAGTDIGVASAADYEANFHNTLNFFVSSNGSLMLPFDEGPLVSGNYGYSLAPNSSVTLRFNGVITFGNIPIAVPLSVTTNGGASIQSGAAGSANATTAMYCISTTDERCGPIPRVGSAVILLIPNQSYGITVQGTIRDRGAVSATANVTATGSINSRLSNVSDVTYVHELFHDNTTNTTTSEDGAGFVSNPGSVVNYTVYEPMGSQLLGFKVLTSGFTLLNVTRLQIEPPCPVCAPGARACPMICIAGFDRYVLKIQVPSYQYVGPLTVEEFYSGNYIVPYPVTAVTNGSATVGVKGTG